MSSAASLNLGLSQNWCIRERVNLHFTLQMEPLEKKLYKEIGENCEIFTSRFPLPNWKPVRIIGEGLDTVWVYSHPERSKFTFTQSYELNEHVQDSARSKEVKGLQWIIDNSSFTVTGIR